MLYRQQLTIPDSIVAVHLTVRRYRTVEYEMKIEGDAMRNIYQNLFHSSWSKKCLKPHKKCPKK